jgi:hypothetical protein
LAWQRLFRCRYQSQVSIPGFWERDKWSEGKK